MNRFASFVVASAAIATSAQIVLAQADAKASYEEGKKAYNAGLFEQARTHFTAASTTDGKNPEVFLWLGRANYQLGLVDEAIAAWQTTLTLAPNEPYATKMLATLRGQGNVESSLALVDTLLNERLYDAALREADRTLESKALTDPQRVKAMLQKATALVGVGRAKDAPPIVFDVRQRFDKLADVAQTNLILGRAYLRLGGEKTGQGLALLNAVAADHAGTPHAASADYEVLAFHLEQAVSAERVEALAKWINANPKHSLTPQARLRLVDVYLAAALQAAPVKAGDPLAKADETALAGAGELFKHIVSSDEADKLTQRVIAHIDARYGKQQAHAAAIAAVETLLKAPLPKTSRLIALKAGARYRVELAVSQLTTTFASTPIDDVKVDPLPPALADALAAFAAINREYPADAAWREQAALAERVRLIATAAPKEGIRANHAFAVQLALPVLKADADDAAIKQAVATLSAIVVQVGQPATLKNAEAAANLSGQIVSALDEKHAAHVTLLWQHVERLDVLARLQFAGNRKAGNAVANEKPSAAQNRLIETLGRIVAKESAATGKAVERLSAHLNEWISHGHFATAEQAFAALAKSIPQSQQKPVRLAIVRLWTAQVFREHERLLGAGLTPDANLNETLKKAVNELYALHAGLEETDPLIVEVRHAWTTIVNHYKKLELYEVAEQVITQKPPQGVPAADAFALQQLALLRTEQGNRELLRAMKQHNGDRKLTLTAGHKAAIEAHHRFITTFPSHPFVESSVNAITAIGQVYEQNNAPEVAAEIYKSFAAFAAGQKNLPAPAAGAPTIADRAAFAAANALDAKARAALAKFLAERKPESPAPEKLSEEFTAALNAYKEFIRTRPDSPLVGTAIQRIMAAALEYTRAEAWDVADAVFADLLTLKLPLRYPDRLEFARAIAQLGKVMPEHAREVLAALTAGRAVPTPAQTTAPRPPTEPLSDVPAMRPLANASAAAEPIDAGDKLLAKNDADALTAIARHEQRRATQIAQLRDDARSFREIGGGGGSGGAGGGGFGNRTRGPGYQQAQGQSQEEGQAGAQPPAVPVLTEAELARIESTFDVVYKRLAAIRQKDATTPVAEMARAEVLVMISHWRSLAQWQRAAALAQRFLSDNPTDPRLAEIRLSIARDHLAYAAKPLPQPQTRQSLLAEVQSRFERARQELARITVDFADDADLRRQAQWDIATSHLTQARTIAAVSPTLARGQFVRAARELQRIGREFSDHPNVAQVPSILWTIAAELQQRGYPEEAIIVWNDLINFNPVDTHARQAGPQVAATYQQLNRPLKAVETWLEVNFARGGNDATAQNAIFQIGARLMNEKRWVEALGVMETFVDSFPKHANAGQALTMVGQIHQANEAWEDAVVAYRRVISEYEQSGNWVQHAKWAIAECIINLSQWREAVAAYEAYVAAYPGDAKVAEANRRTGVLKDLARYQTLVDEAGQRKSFDAQYQIATIVQQQLANPQKAIIEYRKVTAKWPESHLADDALNEVGKIHLSLGETDKARQSLQQLAAKYPDSTLADDALLLIGKSYEDEAQRIAGLTRGTTVARAQEQAQRQAYVDVQGRRAGNRGDMQQKIDTLKRSGQKDAAEIAEASQAGQNLSFNAANFELAARKAEQDVEQLTTLQLADRQDKTNAALRRAVEAYAQTARVPGADKAGDALLRMAVIYDEQLKDSQLALATWKEIVNQFSGTAVAEEASWRIAHYHERAGNYAEAAEAFKGFLRNYRRSPKAGQAQFAIAESYEHLNKWVEAMDAYTNYLNNFADGPLAQKAKEQISWIKTYRL